MFTSLYHNNLPKYSLTKVNDNYYRKIEETYGTEDIFHRVISSNLN